MNRIKIAFFAEILIEDFDGASRTMYQLLHRIPHKEFEFIFFCGVPPDKELGCEVIQFPTFRIPYNNTYQVVFPYFSTGRAKKKLKEFQPDIIHIASPSPLGNFARKYAKKQNIPLIAIYHTHFIPYIKYYFRGLPFLISFFEKKAIQITRTFYKSPDLVYAPSQLVIDELKEMCELDGHNLKLWQRGIDQNLFSPKKKDKSFMRHIVKNDLPTILFVSRLVWEKNLQTLIDLYNLCEREQAQVNFVVAGDGVARREAEKQMPNAFFLGMINHEELATVYASSDVYFFPSDTESFGNVVIEAMASGIPCVVANGGGPKSIINDGEDGFLCPPNDEAYYWDKIQLLLNNKDLRTRMIAKGLDLVATLSWENLAGIYFEDLKKLAAEK